MSVRVLNSVLCKNLSSKFYSKIIPVARQKLNLNSSKFSKNCPITFQKSSHLPNMDQKNLDNKPAKQPNTLREKPRPTNVECGSPKPTVSPLEAALAHGTDLLAAAGRFSDTAERHSLPDPEEAETKGAMGGRDLLSEQLLHQILREHAEQRAAESREERMQAAQSGAPCAPLAEADSEDGTPTGSMRSINSYVCRICHNAENPERLVSPCLCKGSLTYVHIQCLERWISTSRSTTCELCQFQYNTEQTLRYTCLQSLRMWYSRSMSRRALQEDCQMFSLLTLVAFGIIGTLLVGIQYYFLQGHTWGLGKLWTKGWLIFFLFTTLVVYFINIYMIVRSQLAPWYRWWQSARDIKLILENRKPFVIQPTKSLRYPQPTDHRSSESLSSFTGAVTLQPQAVALAAAAGQQQPRELPPVAMQAQPNPLQPATVFASISNAAGGAGATSAGTAPAFGKYPAGGAASTSSSAAELSRAYQERYFI